MNIKLLSKDYIPFKKVLYKFKVSSKDITYETAVVASKSRNSNGERKIFLIQRDGLAKNKVNIVTLGYCTDDIIVLYPNNLPYSYSKTTDRIDNVISSLDRVSMSPSEWSSILTFGVSISGTIIETSLITRNNNVWLIQVDMNNDNSLHEIMLGSYKDWKDYIPLIRSSINTEVSKVAEDEPVEIATTSDTYYIRATARF